MALIGGFGRLSKHEVTSLDAAKKLVEEHAASGGYTKVKYVDDPEGGPFIVGRHGWALVVLAAWEAAMLAANALILKSVATLISRCVLDLALHQVCAVLRD